MLSSKMFLFFYLLSYFSGVFGTLSIESGQSVSFECNIDYEGIVEPILEATNHSLNEQASFSQQLQVQEQTLDDLKVVIQNLPNILSQTIDPISEASNQGIL